MRTNIEIDEQMMAKVMKFLGTRTKRETVEQLLKEKIDLQERIKKQQGIRHLRGKVEFDEETLKEVDKWRLP
jgi:Arc/MetJ family transcription regulator